MRRMTAALLLSLCCALACDDSALTEPVSSDPCRVEGALAAPESIAQVVDLINALPKPLELGCFLHSLKRPLYLDTSTGFVSAQPGPFPRSPRILLIRNNFVLAVAPEGDGRMLLEMSEIDPLTNRSLKGEVKFPVPSLIGPLKPYEDIIYDKDTSTCGFCHDGEQPHPSIPGAYTSLALRPVESDRVPFQDLKVFADECDAQAEPYRCAILQGIFGQGEVFDGPLPDTIPTIE